ncbi:hypothetical protein ACJBU6_00006 [Exserohilum turcicum]
MAGFVSLPRCEAAAPYSNAISTTPLSVPAPTIATSTPIAPLPGTGLQSVYSSATRTSSEYEAPQSSGQAVSAPSNASCTINIPSASLNYWFAPTYSHLIATMTSSALNFSDANSLTLVPNTATFDAASALESDFACTYSYSYYAEYDFTLTNCEPYTGKPTAATTSIVYRSSGYSPFPPEGVIPATDARLYDVYYPDSFPSATIAVTLAPNITQVETSATPFVYFTAYEVANGNKTEQVQLPSAQAYPYWVDGLEEKDTATGPLPKGFLEQVPYSGCVAGQLQATVTVLIIVDLYYLNRPLLDPFIIHFESSVLGFEDPPVLVNDLGTRSSKPLPLTVADWDIPNAEFKPTDHADLPSTTRARGAASVTVGTIGASPVVVGPSSEVVVGSQTLRLGGPPVTVGGGTPVSLAPSATAIIIGGETSLLPQVPPPAPPVLTVGSSTLTPNAATQFLVAPGQTLTPGGVATIDGTIVSLAPLASFVVIGGSTQVLAVDPALAQTTAKAPHLVFGGSTISAQTTPDKLNLAPTFVISDQTLIPGGAVVTVSGTTLSLESSGSVVVVNGVPSTIITQTGPAFPTPTIKIGDSVFSALPQPTGPSFVVGGQTLVPGGPEITVSGTTLSLASSASFVVIDGVKSTLTNAAPAQITAPPLTVGDVTFRPLPGTGTAYLIGSILLTAGGSIVVSGTTISLAPGATALVINGQTSSISPQAQPVVTNPPLLTIGTNTYTAMSGDGTTFVIGGETLTPGGTITVDGTTIGLADSATALTYGSAGRSTTTALFPATTTRSTTNESGATARASRSDGQATATSRKEGAAPRLSEKLSMSVAVVALLFLTNLSDAYGV